MQLAKLVLTFFSNLEAHQGNFKEAVEEEDSQGRTSSSFRKSRKERVRRYGQFFYCFFQEKNNTRCCHDCYCSSQAISLVILRRTVMLAKLYYGTENF